MCDPFTMGLAAGGSSLFKSLSSFGSNSAMGDMAEGNAKLLQTQAEVARGNADLAVTRGNYDQFLIRHKVAQTLGAEKNAFAGGNVDPTYGSPLLIQGYTAAQGEVDAQLARARMLADRANALTQGADIDMQAAGQFGKASQYKGAALTSLVTAPLDAGTAFLTSYKKWPGLDAISGNGPMPINQYGARFLGSGNPWES